MFGFLALTVVVFPVHLKAQGYGSVVGTVTDATGAAVPGASVTATQTDTGRQTKVTTGGAGNFVFPTLPPAEYSLKVESKGFQAYQQKGLVLQADQSLTVNAKLSVGADTETVEVTTTPPQVDTTSGTLSQVIDQERVGCDERRQRSQPGQRKDVSCSGGGDGEWNAAEPVELSAGWWQQRG